MMAAETMGYLAIYAVAFAFIGMYMQVLARRFDDVRASFSDDDSILGWKRDDQ